MKKFVLLLLLSGNFLTVFAGKNPDGPQFKGRVKSISETHRSSIKTAGLQMNITQTFNWKYDDKGRLTEALEKSISIGSPGGDNESNSVKRYAYNDKGAILSIRITSQSKKTEEQSALTEYVYDHDGRRTLEIYTPDEKKNKRTIYTMSYDHNGKLTEIITLSSNEETAGFKEIGRQKNIYDLDGNIAEVHYYDSKTGKFNIGKSSVFDGKKNVIEEKHFYSDGSMRLKQSFTYDKDGRVSELTNETPNGEKNQTQYSYENVDANGNYLKVAAASPKNQEPAVTERVIEYYP